ncbi:MAG: biopolymer transporter ExbD [Planctomycetaceae bacterium]|nr:biopolymer transporter ExbD [Planctomycetaceae bacterium]
MKIRSDFTGHRELNDDQAMTPMIDIVFLLLVFFVCVATDHVVEMALPTELASGGVATEQTIPEETWTTEVRVKLRMTPDQTSVITMNGRSFQDVNSFRSTVIALAEISRESPVLLDVNDDVPLQDVISVYDACRSAQFDRINFVLPAP